MLYQISFAIEFSALLMAIGVGLYLVTRSVHRPEAWLAALTAWSLGGLFLNMLFSLAPPPVENWMVWLLFFWPRGILGQNPAAWLQGWTATLAPAFWFHTTMLVRSETMTVRQKVAIVAGYATAFTGIAIQALIPSQYTTISGEPLLLNSIKGESVYGLFLIIMVLFCSLSIRNLILAARKEPRYLPRRQLILLSTATALAGFTGPVGLVAAFLKIPVPMFMIALLMGAAVLVTSFGIARYSALMENRVFQRDFFYTFFVNSVAVVFYLGITWIVNRLYAFPLHVYILVGVLAVISHPLIDVARQNVDFYFFQQERRLLRESLRSLESQNETDLLKSLSRLLDSVCEPVQANYAVLFVHQEEHFEQAAAYRWNGAESSLPADSLVADDLKLLRSGDLPEPFEKAVYLIPSYLHEQQVGALVLGASEHGLAYSPVELNELQELADYLGGWLSHLIWLRNRQPAPIGRNYPPESGLFGISSDQISTRIVESGLRNLHNYSSLAELSLAEIGLVRGNSENRQSHLEAGKAVHSLLMEALECLRPQDSEEEKRIRGVPRRDWYPYIILRDAYVDCLPNREIMNRLYISEGTFNRLRRSAIRSITQLLIDMENKVPR